MLLLFQQGDADVEVSGSPTERAILYWGIKVSFYVILIAIPWWIWNLRKKSYSLITLQLGMNFEAVRSESSVIHVFPFNSQRKRGGVALHLVMCLHSYYSRVSWFLHAYLSYYWKGNWILISASSDIFMNLIHFVSEPEAFNRVPFFFSIIFFLYTGSPEY